MSLDAVVYAYANTGADLEPVLEGTAYAYANIVDRDAGSTVGRVVGFAAAPRIGVAYLEVNQGVEQVDVQYVVAYAMWNQLEQVSGGARLLEDGAARLLEDGTTERTLE